MMNDPLVLEASRVLASQLTEKEDDPETAIEEAFKRILCRAPNSKELDILSGYFEEEYARFSKDKQSTDDLIRIGEYPIEEVKIKPNTAAMMQVILAMYNLEEAITKI